MRRHTSKQAGFSLIELMVVVAIIGILASIAVPMLMRYIQRSRSAEASQFVQKIYSGARTYYLDTPQPGLIPVPPQFPAPSVGPTPALGECCGQGGKCAPAHSQWEDDAWVALSFSVGDPHYYAYTYHTPDEHAAFTARANGDLDCDGVFSTFEMFGAIDSALADGPTGSASLRRIKETE